MKMFSVTIGVDHYNDQQIPDLEYACNDALRFDRLLECSIDENEQKRVLLLNEQATREDIMGIIGTDVAGQVTSKDMVVIYFAGHGSPELGLGRAVNQANRYLIPYDAKYNNIYGGAIDMERDLVDMVGRLKASTVLLFIDACFSGRAGGRTFEGPKLHDARQGMRSPLSLQLLNLGEGRVMLSAADDNEVAYERGGLGHGIFSYALFETLTDPSHQQATISLALIYDKVTRRVEELSGGRQHPVWNGRDRSLRFPRLREN